MEPWASTAPGQWPLLAQRPALAGEAAYDWLLERAVEARRSEPRVSLEAGRAAVAVAEHLGDPVRRGRALAEVANAHRIFQDLERAGETMDEASRAIAGADPDTRIAEVWSLRASLIRDADGRFEEAAQEAELAAALYGAARCFPSEAKCLLQAAQMRGLAQDYERAVWTCSLASRQLRLAGAPPELIAAGEIAGLVLLVDQAEDTPSEARRRDLTARGWGVLGHLEDSGIRDDLRGSEPLHLDWLRGRLRALQGNTRGAVSELARVAGELEAAGRRLSAATVRLDRLRILAEAGLPLRELRAESKTIAATYAGAKLTNLMWAAIRLGAGAGDRRELEVALLAALGRHRGRPGGRPRCVLDQL